MMTLSIGSQHSGLSSLVGEAGEETLEVPVVRIDQLVAELGLPRVDFIKLDIEGAEREALRGAVQVLKKYRPRLMMTATICRMITSCCRKSSLALNLITNRAAVSANFRRRMKLG